MPRFPDLQFPITLHLVAILNLSVMAPLAHAGINRWTSNGPNLPGVQALAIARTNPQIVYAGTYRGLFKSTDGGLSWLQRLNPNPSLNVLIGKNVQAIAIDPTNAQILYVGVPGSGVYKSTNGCIMDICLGPYGVAGDLPVAGDWFGLGTATIGVFRPGTGRWYLDNGNGLWDGCNVDKCAGPFGLNGDKPVVGDWAGLGKAAIGVFRPGQGLWYLDSGNGAWNGCLVDFCPGPFGTQPGDRPIVGAW